MTMASVGFKSLPVDLLLQEHKGHATVQLVVCLYLCFF